MPVCTDENLSDVQKIIKEAEGMTLEELAKKAIEESNGKTFFGVGNSSRGKSALPLFIEYLQSIDSGYSMEFDWQQPKNNKIVSMYRKFLPTISESMSMNRPCSPSATKSQQLS